MKRQKAKLQRAGAWAIAGSVLAAGTLFTAGASAQEVLPTPPAPFKGQIGLSAKDSTPDFPKPVHAPKGAPNILLVMLDDVGFGAASTFGGPVNTPTLDRLARNGLRYNAFPYHGAFVAHSRGAVDWTQSSLGAYGRASWNWHRLSRLR